jgi:hypothetical protein
MNSFEQTRQKLYSASKEKRDYRRALVEWEYRGRVYDNKLGLGECQLCGQRNIRYEFEIVNEKNRNVLLVGSECITRFGGIRVYDRDGKQLSVPRAKASVHSDKRRLVADSRTKSVLNALVELASKDEEFEIVKFIDYYRMRGAFTPNQLGLVLWRLNKFGIGFERNHFKLTIKRDREKQQLLDMPDWKLRALKECLSPTQLSWIERNRNRH